MADQTLGGIFWHGDEQARRDFTPAADVAPGAVVDLGGLIGVCTSPTGLKANKLGSVATAGVFKLRKVPADALALARGDAAYFHLVNQKLVAAPGAGIVPAGVVNAAAVAGADHAEVDLNRTVPA